MTLWVVDLGELELRAMPPRALAVRLLWTALGVVPVGPAVFTTVCYEVTVLGFLTMVVINGLEATKVMRLVKKGPLERLVQRVRVSLVSSACRLRVMTVNFPCLTWVRILFMRLWVMLLGPTRIRACLANLDLLDGGFQDSGRLRVHWGLGRGLGRVLCLVRSVLIPWLRRTVMFYSIVKTFFMTNTVGMRMLTVITRVRSI